MSTNIDSFFLNYINSKDALFYLIYLLINDKYYFVYNKKTYVDTYNYDYLIIFFITIPNVIIILVNHLKKHLVEDNINFLAVNLFIL